MKITYDFEDGSYVQTKGPWNVPISGKALCPDGKIRKLKRISHISGNVHDLSCAISYNGKTVSGVIRIVKEGLQFVPTGLNANAFNQDFNSISVMEISTKETDNGIDLPLQLDSQ